MRVNYVEARGNKFEGGMRVNYVEARGNKFEGEEDRARDHI
jgi:hypothetical protein